MTAVPKRKYPPVKRRPAYRPRLVAPGHDGEPLTVRSVRDPGGDGKRSLKTLVRNDRLQWLAEHGNGQKDAEGRPHRYILSYQFAAGQRLEEDWRLGVLLPNASMAGGGRGGPGSSGPSDVKCDAMARYGNAMAAVRRGTSYMGASVLFYVTIENRSPAEVARLWECKKSQVMEILRTGLDALARHYNLA